MNYVYSLRLQADDDQAKGYKVKVFSKVEAVAYMDYPNLTRCLKEKDRQIENFHLLKHPEEFDITMELRKEYGNLSNAMAVLKELKEKEGSA